MASVVSTVAVGKDWVFANPWFWLGSGGIFTAWSCLWTLSFGEGANDYRIAVLAVGLLCAGIGVRLRCSDRESVYISLPFARIARLALGWLFALVGVALTVLLGMSFFRDNQTEWKPGVTFLVWLSVAPASYFAWKRCLQRIPRDTDLDAVEETALALAAAALYCILGANVTLNLGGAYADDWDTIRMLLRVLMAVCLFGGALVLVTTRIRRLAVSLVVALHFAGIMTACLSAAPPSPMLATQLWVRIFRPYLQFMYLTNAYQFYAPDPGPSSYLWFRVVYDVPDGGQMGLWYKVPQLDEQGQLSHAASLEYQRFLSLTAGTALFDQEKQPPLIVQLPTGEFDNHPIYQNRMPLSVPRALRKEMLGMPPNPHYRIPLDLRFPLTDQVKVPNDEARSMQMSCVRFVARKFASHPEHPDWTFHSVKLYRVVHDIPMPEWLVNELPPSDPTLYHPFYMGNFDANGDLVNEPDPYLFWLLPIVRADPNDKYSKILNFARLHAGDRDWVRSAGRSPRWGAPEPADQEMVAP